MTNMHDSGNARLLVGDERTTTAKGYERYKNHMTIKLPGCFLKNEMTYYSTGTGSVIFRKIRKLSGDFTTPLNRSKLVADEIT